MCKGKIDYVAATPHVPAAGSTELQITSSKRAFDLTETPHRRQIVWRTSPTQKIISPEVLKLNGPTINHIYFQRYIASY